MIVIVVDFGAIGGKRIYQEERVGEAQAYY
jgi:hypothetical protein